MFGLFKKKITLVEFGQGINQLVNEHLASDCGRALGMRFENWDGWPAPGSEDTELGVLMELEVCHGATEIYAGVQA